jgi:hypothetical protein
MSSWSLGGWAVGRVVSQESRKSLTETLPKYEYRTDGWSDRQLRGIERRPAPPLPRALSQQLSRHHPMPVPSSSRHEKAPNHFPRRKQASRCYKYSAEKYNGRFISFSLDDEAHQSMQAPARLAARAGTNFCTIAARSDC